MRLLYYSTLAEVVEVSSRKPEFLHPQLDGLCKLFNHILVPVVFHDCFAEGKITTSREVLERGRPLVRIVILEVLDDF